MNFSQMKGKTLSVSANFSAAVYCTMIVVRGVSVIFMFVEVVFFHCGVITIATFKKSLFLFDGGGRGSIDHIFDFLGKLRVLTGDF